MNTDTELTEDLAGLLKFIHSEQYFGRGIHTYPTGGVGQVRLYDGCVELERMGLIRRKTDERDHVCFVPCEDDE